MDLTKQWTQQRTEGNGGHSLIPITAKWLASGTDDDEIDKSLPNKK